MGRRNNITGLIPNGLSVLNIIFGFLSIINAIEGSYETASFFILLAMLADASDGKVARKLNATSDIGVIFDSLADVISFGVSPAILIYLYILNTFSYGLYLVIMLVVCAALRLARFSVRPNQNYFAGIPTPAVAFFLAAYVISGLVVNPMWLAALVAVVSILMVSEIKFPTFKFCSPKKLAVLLLITAVFFILAAYDIR
ncbi:MAG: CDP-diacylglycerol--serine O-phosphatidyltransferase, partial [archaeon]